MIYAPFTWSSRTTVTIGWVFYTLIIILTSETCPIQFNTYWFSTGLLHIFVQSSIVSRVREKSRLFYAIWLWSFVSEHVLNKSAKSKKDWKCYKQKRLQTRKISFPCIEIGLFKTNQPEEQILQWLWGYKTSLVNNYHFIPRFITWITGISIP